MNNEEDVIYQPLSRTVDKGNKYQLYHQQYPNKCTNKAKQSTYVQVGLHGAWKLTGVYGVC
jgi:hypothetical protein